MILDIQIFQAATTELELSWHEVHQEATSLASSFDSVYSWPNQPLSMWSVDVDTQQDLTKLMAILASLSRRYPDWLWFTSSDDILERWGVWGIFWRQGKPIGYKEASIRPEDETILRAKDSHIDLQLDCDLYADFQAIEPLYL